jgi:hypothetical protein
MSDTDLPPQVRASLGPRVVVREPPVQLTAQVRLDVSPGQKPDEVLARYVEATPHDKLSPDDLLAAVAGSWEWRSWGSVGSSRTVRTTKGVKPPAPAVQTPPASSYASYKAGIGALPGRCVLVTRDHDLFQCLRSGSVIMDDMSGKPWNEGRFREEYGIDPAQWMTVRFGH